MNNELNNSQDSMINQAESNIPVTPQPIPNPTPVTETPVVENVSAPVSPETPAVGESQPIATDAPSTPLETPSAPVTPPPEPVVDSLESSGVNSTMPNNQGTPKKPSKLPIILIIIGVVIAAGVAVAVFGKSLFGKTDNNKNTNNSSSNTKETKKFATKMEDDLALLKRYFKAKGCFNVLNYSEYKDDDIIKDASKSIEFLEWKMGFEPIIYIKYNDRAYKVLYEDYSEDWCPDYKDVEFVYEPHGKEGQTIKYSYDGTKANEKDWIILYDNDKDYEIMSLDVLATYKSSLGEKIDKEEKGCKTAECYGSLIESNFDSIVNEYNNIVSILNSESEKLITNSNKIDVRALGTNADSKNAENASYVNDDLLASGFYILFGLNHVDTNISSLSIKDADTNYEGDYIRLLYFGFAKDDAGYEQFDFASRMNDGGRRYYQSTNLDVGLVSSGHSPNFFYILTGSGASELQINFPAINLRPVVKIAK